MGAITSALRPLRRKNEGTRRRPSQSSLILPRPGVLLFHQVDGTPESWDDVAVQLAAADINTLTVDLRGFGESGGTPTTNKLTRADGSVHCFFRHGRLGGQFWYVWNEPHRDSVHREGALMEAGRQAIASMRAH
jgi:pimeloyl-ACP methyl ester carboxylesterase